MKPKGSVRISIVDQSLVDCIERLRDLKPTPRARELRAKAQAYDRAVKAWSLHPPNEEQRSTMVKLVLELNLEVMALARTPEGTD